VDDAHGGLDVMAGSHRANIARAQADRALDLPRVRLRAERGDLTVHMSCELHRSTRPATHERRVAATGSAPAPARGANHARDATTKICTEVADLADAHDIARLAQRAADIGDLDALVHSAGLSPSMCGWRAILDVDLVATVILLDAFLTHARAGTVAV